MLVGMKRIAALGAAAALALAGCGDDNAPVSSTEARVTPVSTAAPTATATATPQGIDTLEGASAEPRVAEAGNRETALLSAVRAARHEGYDRVVFEFSNETPGYDVRYVAAPVHADGSGAPVSLAGEHVLLVRMKNALDADLSRPGAPTTYEGPARVSPATPEIAELARVGGFEGVLTWAIGLNDRVDFRVSTLGAPPRLIVDVRNH